MILDFPYLYGLYGLHLKTYTLTVVKYGKVCFILPSLLFILSGAFQALQTLQNTLIPDQRCSISGFTFVMKPKGRSMKGRSWIAGGQGASRATAHHKSTGSSMPACQHRTCLHRRVLLHVRRWSLQEPRALTCVSDSEESDEDRELQRYFKIVGV